MQRLITIAVLLCCVTTAYAQETEMSVFRQAEALYSSGKYGPAHGLYKVLYIDHKQEHARVRLRYADTLWRTKGFVDRDARVRAREILLKIAVEADAKGRDQLWAEAHESLGDLYWVMRRARSWPTAWEHYEKALDWWMTKGKPEFKKDRLYRILWKIALPPWSQNGSSYGEWGNFIPAQRVLQVIELANSKNEIAGAHYLLARAFANEGFAEDQVRKEFEEAIRLAAGTNWLDDALFFYAQWLERQKGDGPQKALQYYRRIVAEFSAESSPFFETAKEHSVAISTPVIRFDVTDVAPGEDVSIGVTSRNLGSIDVQLFKVDLANDLNLTGITAGRSYWTVGNRRWFDQLDFSKARSIQRWTLQDKAKGSLQPDDARIQLGDGLSEGAYVVQGTSGSVRTREIFFISRLFVALSRTESVIRVFVADKLTGLPVENAKIRIWEKRSVAIDAKIQKYVATTARDGIAETKFLLPAPLPMAPENPSRRDQLVELVAVAESENSVGAIADPEVAIRKGEKGQWSVSVTTDKRSVCVGEKVRWKLLGSKTDYLSREHDRVVAELILPTDETALTIITPLREFGRADGEFRIDPKWSNGEYRILFYYTTKFGGEQKPMGEYIFLVDAECPKK